MYAVLMAGGQGTRLWPKSRAKTPKQLHALVGEKTLIQQTYANLLLAIKPENFIVSTTPQYMAEIKKQLPDIPRNNFVVEPYPMGTAAACGLVSKIISLRDPEATVAFFPSDHNIKQPEKFAKLLKYVEKVAAKFPDHILTIGLKPKRADTGLGYIHLGKKIDQGKTLATFKVKRFVEKPDVETAKKYLESGEYLWNAGMFVWQTKYVLGLFEKDLPKTDKVIKKIADHIDKPDFEKVLAENYRDVDNTSIDYGIMEKNSDILVVPGDFGWSDVGTWNTILEVLSEIDGTNVVSRGHHLSVGDSNTLVLASDKLIATVGLEDIVVVDTPDAVLVCKRDEAHRIKELINKIKDQNKHEYL